MLPNFSLQRPTALDEAVQLVSFDSLPYVGGTELLAAMKMGLLQPDQLVDLKRIPALRAISRTEGELVIGAAATHYEIAQHPLVLEQLPLLAEVETLVGNVRVRASGSIGGNICFAEPKSDITTTLMALGADLTLVSPAGSRRLSIDDFLLGPYTTAREEQEILTAIHVRLDAARRGVYEKYQTMERPTAGIALVESNAERVLVVGAVGGQPERFTFTPNDPINAESIASTVEIIPDLTGSERYKRHIVAVYIKRALARLESGAAQ